MAMTWFARECDGCSTKLGVKAAKFSLCGEDLLMVQHLLETLKQERSELCPYLCTCGKHFSYITSLKEHWKKECLDIYSQVKKREAKLEASLRESDA